MPVDPYIARGVQPVGNIGNALLQIEGIKQDRQRTQLADNELARRYAADQNAMTQQTEQQELQENLGKILAGNRDPRVKAATLAEMRAEAPNLAGLPDDALWEQASQVVFARTGYVDPAVGHQQRLAEIDREAQVGVADDERAARAAADLERLRAGNQYGLERLRQQGAQSLEQTRGEQTRQTAAQTAAQKPPKPALSQTDTNRAKIKLNNIALAKKQLGVVAERFKAIQSTMSAGPAADKFAYTQAGRAFDKAVDAMRSSVSSLTRVPGVGAMSDYETRLDQAKMPSRGEYESVTGDQITNLQIMFDELERGYQDLLGEAPAAPAVAAGGAENDPLGIR